MILSETKTKAMLATGKPLTVMILSETKTKAMLATGKPLTCHN